MTNRRQCGVFRPQRAGGADVENRAVGDHHQVIVAGQEAVTVVELIDA